MGGNRFTCHTIYHHLTRQYVFSHSFPLCIRISLGVFKCGLTDRTHDCSAGVICNSTMYLFILYLKPSVLSKKFSYFLYYVMIIVFYDWTLSSLCVVFMISMIGEMSNLFLFDNNVIYYME
jgi:hypothetical protein